MNEEEYYTRIEKINNRFKTDRVSADEEYQLVCQKNYLSTKYIEHLEQQCKKQKEEIDDYKEDISNLLDIINKNCNELKCTSDEWLVIQKYQDKEAL